MKRTPLAALVLLIALSPNSVYAQTTPLDGNVLKTICSEPFESAHARFCQGYVDGYMDGFRNSIAASTVGAKICLPEHLTVGDWLAAVQKYLADSSHDLNQPADIVVSMALYGAYGCKPSN
jgi:hypothetical protein